MFRANHSYNSSSFAINKDQSIQPASSANLFGSGFKKNDLPHPMESFENHQFDSFVNDSKPQQANYLGQAPPQSNFQQQQLFASSNQQNQSVVTSVPPPPFASLPPMGSHNQGPPFQKFSGPSSLEERSSGNPFRNRNKQRTHQVPSTVMYTPGTLTPVTFAPPVSTQPAMSNPTNFVQSEFNMETAMTEAHHNVNDQIDLDKGIESVVLNMKIIESRRKPDSDPDDNPDDIKEPWKVEALGRSFSEYSRYDIAPEKIKQAQDENESMRANRESTCNRFEEMRLKKIAEQKALWAEKEKQQKELQEPASLEESSKSSESLNLTAKHLSREERKKLRKKADKVRQMRSNRPQNQDNPGSLEGLINEVSSRGTSLCSDLSDVNQLETHSVDPSTSWGLPISKTGMVTPDDQNQPYQANHQHDHTKQHELVINEHGHITQLETTGTSNIFFHQQQKDPPDSVPASNLFNVSNQQSENTSSASFFNQLNTPQSSVNYMNQYENKSQNNSDNFFNPPVAEKTGNEFAGNLFNYVHSVNHSSTANLFSQENISKSDSQTGFFNPTDQPAASNVPSSDLCHQQGQQSLVHSSARTLDQPGISLESSSAALFSDANSMDALNNSATNFFNQPKGDPVQTNLTSSFVNTKESQRQKVIENNYDINTTNAIQQQPPAEQNDVYAINQPRSQVEEAFQQPPNKTSYQNQVQFHEEDSLEPSENHFDAPHVNQISTRASSEESQGAVSSTSMSSYGLISSTQTSGRVSPYQFIDNHEQIQAQSTLNSAEISPLERTSSYEKVVLPSSASMDMSSYDMSVNGIPARRGETSQIQGGLQGQMKQMPVQPNAAEDPTTAIINQTHALQEKGNLLFQQALRGEPINAQPPQQLNQQQQQQQQPVALQQTELQGVPAQLQQAEEHPSQQLLHQQLQPTPQLDYFQEEAISHKTQLTPPEGTKQTTGFSPELNNINEQKNEQRQFGEHQVDSQQILNQQNFVSSVDNHGVPTCFNQQVDFSNTLSNRISRGNLETERTPQNLLNQQYTGVHSTLAQSNQPIPIDSTHNFAKNQSTFPNGTAALPHVQDLNQPAKKGFVNNTPAVAITETSGNPTAVSELISQVDTRSSSGNVSALPNIQQYTPGFMSKSNLHDTMPRMPSTNTAVSSTDNLSQANSSYQFAQLQSLNTDMQQNTTYTPQQETTLGTNIYVNAPPTIHQKTEQQKIQQEMHEHHINEKENMGEVTGVKNVQSVPNGVNSVEPTNSSSHPQNFFQGASPNPPLQKNQGAAFLQPKTIVDSPSVPSNTFDPMALFGAPSKEKPSNDLASAVVRPSHSQPNITQQNQVDPTTSQSEGNIPSYVSQPQGNVSRASELTVNAQPDSEVARVPESSLVAPKPASCQPVVSQQSLPIQSNIVPGVPTTQSIQNTGPDNQVTVHPDFQGAPPLPNLHQNSQEDNYFKPIRDSTETVFAPPSMLPKPHLNASGITQDTIISQPNQEQISAQNLATSSYTQPNQNFPQVQSLQPQPSNDNNQFQTSQQATPQYNQYMQQGMYGQHPYMQGQYGMNQYGQSQHQAYDYAAWQYQQQWLQYQQYYGMNYGDYYQQYGWNQWPHPYDTYSYSSSAASSTYGDSRPGSVIERRSPSTDAVLSEIADMTSELSFAERAATPPPEEVIQRTTPLAFTRPHAAASFNKAGGFLTVVGPKQPLDGEIAFVQNAKIEEIVPIPMLKRFPGPLIRGESSKKQILNFIGDTVNNILPQTFNGNEYIAQKALWEFVAMLVRQNGTFDGSDVAELLLSLLPNCTDSEGNETKNLVSLSNPQPVLPEKVREEFQLYVVSGRLKDALELSLRHKDWGNAFMLAHTMGNKYVAVTQSRFFQSLKDSDPLKTMFGHLLNKDINFIKKRASPSYWIQNLCVLVSQTCGDKNKDKERIIAFGDSLRSLNIIGGAHLCFLISDITFGSHTNPDERIVLLGQEHKNYIDKRIGVWSQPLNVQLTEIYQYAKRLHQPSFVIPSFQIYLVDYSRQIYEYGYGPQALAYFEAIAASLVADNTHILYNYELCSSVSKCSHRILLQDVEHYEDKENPPWLLALDTYRAKLTNEYLPKHTPVKDPAAFVTEHSTVKDPAAFVVDRAESFNTQEYHRPELVQETPHMTEETPYIPDDQHIYDEKQDYTDKAYLNNENFNADSYNYSEYTEQDIATNQIDSYTSHTEGRSDIQYDGQQDNFQHNYQPYEEPSMQTMAPQFIDTYNIDSNTQLIYQPDQFRTQPTQSEYAQPYTDSSDRYEEYTTEDPSTTSTSELSSSVSPPNTFRENEPRYIQQEQTNQAEEVEEEDLFGGFSKHKHIPRNTQKSNNEDPEKKKETPSKPKSQTPSKKGWMTSILSKFSGNKEIHLPDDKDQSIVFDEKLGKWVDKNADPEAEKAALPPPPKIAMGDPKPPSGLSGDNKPTPIGTAPPGAMALAPAPLSNDLSASKSVKKPSAASVKRTSRHTKSTLLQQSKFNSEPEQPQDEDIEETAKPPAPPSKFSLRAHGGSRRGNRYVNAMASSSKSTPAAPVLDPFQVATTSITNGQPPASTTVDNTSESAGSSSQMPMFFNPAQMTAGPTSKTPSTRSRLRR